MAESIPKVPGLRRAVVVTVLQQLAATVWASLVDLNVFTLSEITFHATVAYWGGFALVWWRRHRSLTRFDLLAIKWGFPVVWIISCVISQLIWKARGW